LPTFTFRCSDRSSLKLRKSPRESRPHYGRSTFVP